jgi:hypothetical protein
MMTLKEKNEDGSISDRKIYPTINPFERPDEKDFIFSVDLYKNFKNLIIDKLLPNSEILFYFKKKKQNKINKKT